MEPAGNELAGIETVRVVSAVVRVKPLLELANDVALPRSVRSDGFRPESELARTLITTDAVALS